MRLIFFSADPSATSGSFLELISENDDEALLATANTVLGKSDNASRNGA